MAGPRGHLPAYHPWPNSTPVIDVLRTVVAVASVVIGAHAVLFLTLALWSGNSEAATSNALFLVAIAAANGLVDALRHWRRHHG